MLKPLTVALGAILLFARVHAQTSDNSDRILHFASEVGVYADGHLEVKETITVFNGDGTSGALPNGQIVESHNNSIEHGIYREFPTIYKDANGFFTQTGFRLRSVRMNGSPEHYKTENARNGVRILIGNKDVVLAPGLYVYELIYETNRQIHYAADRDELNWNVNGNGWGFGEDTVSCVITFPESANILEDACYTGVQGSTEHACRSEIRHGNSIYFESTRKLDPYEGLTVSAAIPKGLIQQPGRISNFFSFLRSNYIIPVLSLVVLFLFVFYFRSWQRKGRDPKEGTIFPQFAPPDGLLAADCGYILEQKYGPHLFTAALIESAVKKELAIEVTREGLLFKTNVYHFVQPPNAVEVSTTERYGFEVSSLYGEKAQKGTYNPTLKKYYDALSALLKQRFQAGRAKGEKSTALFALNKGYSQFGCLILLASIFLSVYFITQHASLQLAVITAALLVILFIIHTVFARIMSAYTVEGRRIADHLLGFRMYLETAEQRVYDQLTPPERTLELFEKYLPYAIALKVENAWAGKFEDIMQRALEQGYTPTYYSMGGGGYHSFSMSDMSQGISSGLSGTISSASTPPSSSSGGASGGGGGGGGGGGW